MPALTGKPCKKGRSGWIDSLFGLAGQRSGIALQWALVLVVLSNGCGLGWHAVYASQGAHDNGRVRVEEKCGLSDCNVRVVAVFDGALAEIAHRRGCTINFAHAVWVGDVIGVFVDGGTCQTMEMAYDARSHHEVPFLSVKSRLRAEIAAAYKITPKELQPFNGDVLAWATYPGDGSSRRSMDEFRKRYR